jgi:hypothetical protein
MQGISIYEVRFKIFFHSGRFKAALSAQRNAVEFSADANMTAVESEVLFNAVLCHALPLVGPFSAR